MAVPAELNLTITRGDTESVVVTITSDGTTPVNITGRTYTAQMRSNEESAIVSATFTCTVTNGAAGEVTAVASATATAALIPGYYRWDLQENASGIISTIVSGEVTVLGDVTR